MAVLDTDNYYSRKVACIYGQIKNFISWIVIIQQCKYYAQSLAGGLAGKELRIALGTAGLLSISFNL